MNPAVNLAIVGAAAPAAAVLLEYLHRQSAIAIDRVFVLDLDAASMPEMDAGHRRVDVHELDGFEFGRVQLAIFLADASVSAEYAPLAVEQGCIVVDASAAFRNSASVPLVVSGVNHTVLDGWQAPGIVALPSAATAALARVLAPLQQAAGLERLNVVQLVPASSLGSPAVDELGRQTADLLSFRAIMPDVYPQQIAFNLLPADTLPAGGGMVARALELRRLFGQADLPVGGSTLRVPVFFGHCDCVTLQTAEAVEIADVRRMLSGSRGIIVGDEAMGAQAVSPVTHASGQDEIHIGNLQVNGALPRALDLIVVSDNIRVGIALNALEVAVRLLAG